MRSGVAATARLAGWWMNENGPAYRRRYQTIMPPNMVVAMVISEATATIIISMMSPIAAGLSVRRPSSPATACEPAEPQAGSIDKAATQARPAIRARGKPPRIPVANPTDHGEPITRPH